MKQLRGINGKTRPEYFFIWGKGETERVLVDVARKHESRRNGRLYRIIYDRLWVPNVRLNLDAEAFLFLASKIKTAAVAVTRVLEISRPAPLLSHRSG